MSLNFRYFGDQYSNAESNVSYFMARMDSFETITLGLQKLFGDRLTANEFNVLLCCVQLIVVKYIKENNDDQNNKLSEPYSWQDAWMV